MRIGMILRGNFPPDIRVEKETRTLISAGHEVFLLCYKNQRQTEEELIDGLRVKRIKEPWREMPLLGHKWNSLKFHLVFRNDYWAKKISPFVKDYNLDVLHIHDLPLLGTAISVSKKFRLPLVADLHENYPAALEILNIDKINFLERFYKKPKRWSLYERRTLGGADKIIVVVKEAKNRLLEDLKVPERKITLLMNVVDTKYLSEIKLIPEILKQYKENFIILYVGGGGFHRGLESAVQAFRYLKAERPEIKMILVGPVAEERDRLLKIVKKENLERRVELAGWQEFKKIPSYIQASDICLVPHLQNYHTETTIPHKLFQYMFFKKPVLVSDCKPLKRIVEENTSGLVFKSGDPEDLARKIIRLYEDSSLRVLLGQNGYDSVINHYNWAMEGKKLVSLYKSFT